MIDVHAPWKKIKRQNIIHYFKWVYGWKLNTCVACAGSGYYDNTGSPKCGCCEGSGKVRVRGDNWLKTHWYTIVNDLHGKNRSLTLSDELYLWKLIKNHE